MLPGRAVWLIGVLSCAVLDAPLAAHHSIARVYDRARTTRLEGTVLRFEFISPHPLITMEVVDADGRTRQWRLEMDNRWELVGLGFRADTLKPGDRIAVTGSPSRTDPERLYVRLLERPADRFRYAHHR